MARKQETTPPLPLLTAILGIVCAGWSAMAAAQSPAQEPPRYGAVDAAGSVQNNNELLIEYHRNDALTPLPATAPGTAAAGANPLRYDLPPEIAMGAPAASSALAPPHVSTPAPVIAPANFAAESVAPIRKDVELQTALYEAKPAGETATPAAPSPSRQTHIDSAVDANGGARLLAPQSSPAHTSGGGPSRSRDSSLLPQTFSRFKSLSTAGGGLAIVLGLFLVCMWLLRGSASKSGSSLPTEAFAVLGRAPLTAQSFAQLLRLGNKLVLVAIAADGAQPLAEVTDPDEVDRIAALCAKTTPHGPSAEFQQVLEQLSREPARGFLGREASSARRRA